MGMPEPHTNMAVLTRQPSFAKAISCCGGVCDAVLQANCGQVEVDGDGVCPVETATVPGAELLVLPDVWHDAAPDKLWYGSREVVEQWDKYLP